ncbi:MAG: hypothetical protein LBJ41_10365 [Treponema sp.]|nr:hypothetical protein [Treponema sp.]
MAGDDVDLSNAEMGSTWESSVGFSIELKPVLGDPLFLASSLFKNKQVVFPVSNSDYSSYEWYLDGKAYTDLLYAVALLLPKAQTYTALILKSILPHPL